MITRPNILMIEETAFVNLEPHDVHRVLTPRAPAVHPAPPDSVAKVRLFHQFDGL
jgi:hypothetical protein